MAALTGGAGGAGRGGGAAGAGAGGGGGGAAGRGRWWRRRGLFPPYFHTAALRTLIRRDDAPGLDRYLRQLPRFGTKAAQTGLPAAMRWLHDHGLTAAAQRGAADVVRYLLVSLGVDVRGTLPSRCWESLRSETEERGHEFTDGPTPLMEACKVGAGPIVEMLLRCGADTNLLRRDTREPPLPEEWGCYPQRNVAHFASLGKSDTVVARVRAWPTVDDDNEAEAAREAAEQMFGVDEGSLVRLDPEAAETERYCAGAGGGGGADVPTLLDMCIRVLAVGFDGTVSALGLPAHLADGVVAARKKLRGLQTFKVLRVERPLDVDDAEETSGRLLVVEVDSVTGATVDWTYRRVPIEHVEEVVTLQKSDGGAAAGESKR